ncbi:hypothetical protein ACFX1R_014997 [Malus domestica]
MVPKLLHFLFNLHITNILPSFETHNLHSHHRCSSINNRFHILLLQNGGFLRFAILFRFLHQFLQCCPKTDLTILPNSLRSVSFYSHDHNPFFDSSN